MVSGLKNRVKFWNFINLQKRDGNIFWRRWTFVHSSFCEKRWTDLGKNWPLKTKKKFSIKYARKRRIPVKINSNKFKINPTLSEGLVSQFKCDKLLVDILQPKNFETCWLLKVLLQIKRTHEYLSTAWELKWCYERGNLQFKRGHIWI